MAPGERIGARWLAAPDVRRVMQALARDGRAARFVGGCVRDALLDPTDPGADIDVATPLPPEQVMALIAEAGLTPLPTGLRHGTVGVHSQHRRFEITTLRRDVACDGRHAVVAYTDDFATDAARRDFTINALSADADGTLHDPLGGLADLAAGRVRFVGDPRQRIQEDYLRILRFFRFQARFGRHAPDPAALAACAALRAGIDRLSGERIRQELWRILSGPRAPGTLELMRITGVLDHVVPEAGSSVDLDLLAPADPLLRLAGLIRPADSGRVDVLSRRLRLSNREDDRLRRLVVPPMPDFAGGRQEMRLALHRLGAATFADQVRLARAAGQVDSTRAAELLAMAAAWREPVLPLQGADLLALGMSRGPAVGRVLAEVRSAWEASDFTLDRDACLALARAHIAAR
jgi:poly(A) polymerase